MTKCCHPLEMSETMNMKQLTGDSIGLVVVIILSFHLLDSAVPVDLFTFHIKALYH